MNEEPILETPPADVVRDLGRALLCQKLGRDQSQADVHALLKPEAGYVLDGDAQLHLSVSGADDNHERHAVLLGHGDAFRLGCFLMEHTIERDVTTEHLRTVALPMVRRILTKIGLMSLDEWRRTVRDLLEEKIFAAAQREAAKVRDAELKRVRLAVVTLAQAAAAQTQRERDRLLQDDDVVAIVRSCLEVTDRPAVAS